MQTIKNIFTQKRLAAGLLVATATLASPAFAAEGAGGFDVTSIVATLQLVLAAVALLGTTVLTIYATVAGYKLVRSGLR